MTPKQLHMLATTYAAHVKRGLYSLADRVGTHTRFFINLEKGRGGHIDTFNRAYAWFDANWPADLEWPAAIPRPSQGTAKERAA
jgi:hypothetical protein